MGGQAPPTTGPPTSPRGPDPIPASPADDGSYREDGRQPDQAGRQPDQDGGQPDQNERDPPEPLPKRRRTLEPLITLTQGEEGAPDPSWHEPYNPEERGPPVRTRVHTQKHADKAEFLPAIATTNVRSLGPKIRAFIRDFKNRQLSLALVAETWATRGR